MKAQRRNDASSEEKMSLLSRSMLTGFIGGLLWSSIGSLMYYFNFSEVAPRSFILKSWLNAAWTDRWLGLIITILIAGIISVIAAFIYYGLFRKINSIWMGSIYGIIMWVIIFYIMQPVFPNIPAFMDLTFNTHISTLCLFILYGTFIGYSISYDYHEVGLKEPQKAKE
ncbi:YqhR family membrane protein [Oceanobacillus massiliensis]|uniref:YqhR family membrane protein n=1 Tax=Oceanobacillus massiliensis TaxID=1465765 RepID=UPI0002894CAE|nr:YqhR family membrane protein [Oceanobacillus massiliensis]